MQNLAEVGRKKSDGKRRYHVMHKVATRMPHEFRAHKYKGTNVIGHNRLLDLAHTHLDDNTSATKKTNKETSKNTWAKSPKRVDLPMAWVLTETN